MAAAIRLRSDYSADELRRLAKTSRDARQTRRLLVLASIYEGGSRTAAARSGGVGLQIVRDWVVRFNAEGPPGLRDRKAPGQAPRLTPEHLAALARAVEAGPKPYRDGVVRWRLGDLAAWLREEFGVSVSETTEAMQAHLAEITAAVDPGAHAVLILDQAGWHVSTRLVVPENITLLTLPPRSPELNPVENVWQFIRQNWLSNRVFDSYDDIVAHCCEAWNRLADQPWRIMSLGLRDWAHGF